MDTETTQEFAEASIASNMFIPVGDTGLDRIGGYVIDEPVHALRGLRWNAVVKEMVSTSAIVASMLFAVEMLIRRAEWNMVVAPDGGSEAQEVADFVESCRHDMRTPWEDTLSEILSFLAYGYDIHEVVLKRRLGPEGTFSAQNGLQHVSKYEDGMIGWDEWSPRSQDTVYRWLFDERGHAVAFEQLAPSMAGPVAVPLSRCLHFKAGGYRGSPEGKSALRAAYDPWQTIRKLTAIENTGIERDLAGLPVALVPNKYLRALPGTSEAKTLTAIKKVVTQVRNGDQAGVIFPLEYDEDGHETFQFKLMNSGGTRQFNMGEVISRHATYMTMTMLADFLMVGHGGAGSFALSENKTSLFTTAISSWLDLIANVINDQAVKPLVRLNGLDPRLTPSLRPGQLDEVNLTAQSQFFTAMQPALSLLNVEDRLEVTRHLFDLADWPNPTTTAEDLEAEKAKRDAQAAAIVAGTQEKDEKKDTEGSTEEDGTKPEDGKTPPAPPPPAQKKQVAA